MRQISLSQGKLAIVDDEDYPLVKDFKWCFRGDSEGSGGYALRHIKIDGKDRKMYLHRQLMQPEPGKEVIFLNHDKLDCRRSNLKVVSHEEARRHHRVRRDSKTGVKGVRHDPGNNTWSAYVYRNDCCHHIGTFGSIEAASAAYEAEIRNENPGLDKAPLLVERPDTGSVQQGKENLPNLSA
jgi:hypothetical protein